MLLRLARSLVFAGIGTAILSCFYPTSVTPSSSTPAATGVSVEHLWRQPERYKGQRVQCYVVGGDYRVAPFAVNWFDGNPTNPPGVVFQASRLPDSNDETLCITGTCQGFDNGRTLVTQCEITVIRRRLP